MAKKRKKESAGNKKSTAKDLKSLQKSWKKAAPRTVGAPVPDDSYSAVIESVVIEHSKSSGRRQAHWVCKISEGDYAGRTVRKYSGMDTEDNLSFLQGDLETLELPIPEEIDDLGEVLEDAAGLAVEINVRTKDEFSNVDFIELLEGDNESEDENEDENEDTPEEDENEDEDGSEEENDELTKADVKKMDGEELEDAIDDYDLDVNPKDYKTVAALRKAVIKEL